MNSTTEERLDAAFNAAVARIRADREAVGDRLEAARKAIEDKRLLIDSLAKCYEPVVSAIQSIRKTNPVGIDSSSMLHSLTKLGRTIGHYHHIDGRLASPAAVRDDLKRLERAAGQILQSIDLSPYVDGVAIDEKPDWTLVAQQMRLILKLGAAASNMLPKGRKAPKTIEPMRSARPWAGVDARTACAAVVREAHAMLWPEEDELENGARKAWVACDKMFEAATGKTLLVKTGSAGEGWQRWLEDAKGKRPAVEAFRQHARTLLRVKPLPPPPG